MLYIALKMLLEDKTKYLGIITGIALASLIMIQQPGILLSMLTHIYGVVSDVGLPDIWVMDPKVEMIDDSKPMLDTQLYRVRGVQGVDWAVPFYKGGQKALLAGGETVNIQLLGLDDATMIGGPAVMVQGSLEDLRQPDAVILDENSANGRMAGGPGGPGHDLAPIRVGDTFEVNEKTARVVGIAKASQAFDSRPTLYTTYTRAKNYALSERKMLTFILVKAKTDEPAPDVARRITRDTGLAAYTADEFKQKSLDNFLRHSNILVNFGFVVLIGFVVGAAVTGQLFYNFTMENLRYFGVFKAMGASDRLVIGMVLLQAALVGSVGFGIGAGASAAFAMSTKGSGGPSLLLNWQLLAGCGAAVFVMVLGAACISLRKVLTLEPGVVLKG
ncbi:MAG: putative ABC transport system permease [Desulfovibrionaceae bacterium]|nr:MAG: putative ABC transport system permease [Desulfovibrionaceae bacterium]